MSGQVQQPAPKLSGTRLLLRDAEIEFCKLRAEKEALEIRMSEVNSNDAAFRLGQIRDELRAVMDRMDAVQIEQCEHRIALLQEQLPHDHQAVVPLQAAFDRADEEYIQAQHNREIAAAALYNAKMKVGSAESSIGFYESSIEKLKHRLATQGSQARLASEIASEITGLETRLGRLRTIAPQSPVTETGLIG